MRRSTRRSLVALAATVVVALLGGPATAGSPAQDDTPDTTVDTSEYDRPFSRGYYIIHLLGTNTMDGFVEKDVYILHPEAPKDGWFLTADGMGGTFSNKGDLKGGPFTTPRQVCDAAKGLEQQAFGVEDRYWDCRVLGAGGKGDNGIGAGGLVAALGAGAAALLGIPLVRGRIRNRPRPGWAEQEPRPGLSSECLQALQELQAGVDQVMGKVSDLQLARDGALRQAAAANTDAALLESLTRGQAATAATAGTVSAGSGTLGTGTDVAGIAGSMAEIKAAQMAADARRLIEQGTDLRSTVQAMRLRLTLDMLGRGSTILDADTIASYANQARALQASGGTALQSAGALTSRLQTLGQGLGWVNLVASTISLAAGASQYESLDLLGQWKMEAELKRAEAERWLGLAADIGSRVDELKPEFDAKVAAYNARAQVCGAAALAPPPWDEVVQQMAAPPSPEGRFFAPPNQAVPNVVGRGPQPLDRDDPGIDGCERATYDRLVAEFDQAVAGRDRAAHQWHVWYERLAQIDTSMSAVRQACDTAQAYFDERLSWSQGFSATGLGATAVPLVFTVPPVAAIVLGVTSIVSSYASGASAPDETKVVELGKLKALAQELPNIRASVSQESVRWNQQYNSYCENVADRASQLATMHARCGATATPPWPAPPAVPKQPTLPPLDSSARPYTEIIRWR